MKLILLVALLAFGQRAAALDKVVCYYQSWASYDGISPEDLDPNLCTHINYAFIDLDTEGNLVAEDEDLDVNQGLFSRTTDLKTKNPNLKVLLSIGGASVDPDKFSQVAASSTKRATFVESATDFLDTYNFDGLDIDWEVPQGKDKKHFVSLLKELRSAFDERGWLLTAAVASDVSDGYDVPQLNKLLDYINIMSYDFYGSWSEYTGQNSPLYASSEESDWERENLNLAASGQQWTDAGASPGKIVMGVAFYGRSFTLQDPNDNGIHAAITGTGIGDGGYVEYKQICSELDDWERIWDDEQKNPIKINGNQWLGYDDVESLAAKMEHIKSQNYGGVMMWAVDADDVHGKCGEKQLLLKTLNNNL